jgi:transposase
VGVKRRRFAPEVPVGAVRIVRKTGKQVARDLGINEYSLYNWVKLEREQTVRAGVVR